MSERSTTQVAPFLLPVLAASNVGVWERDPAAGTVRCDPTMARLYGFDEGKAAEGIRLAALRQTIHPDDRALFSDRVQAQANRGGLLVIEYRVRLPDGAVRWMLVRGHYEPIRPDHPIAGGHGIVIDITQSKLDGQGEDGAYFARAYDEDDALLPLHRAADHALGLRRALLAMGEEGAALLPATDHALVALGRRLARLAGRSSDGEPGG